ncbi:MAG: glycosyltransferase family 39 protein, partial [Acidobacteria bacterium]|nr:glycosyltransferase family 39 protein [Acidobacteriota bacterium]
MGRSEPLAVVARGRAAAVLAVLALIAAIAAVYAACGGQLALTSGAIRISLRNPFNPTAAAALAATVAWMLDRHSAARAWARARALVDRSAPAMVGIVVAATFSTAVSYGSFVAGGADSSGYLNQARSWRTLAFHEPHPLTGVSWRHRANILSPLGFVPATDFGTIVPFYPPGFPILMAAAERLGGDGARFLVVPFAGAATVLLVFVIARRFGGGLAGIVAATLTATSPIFTFQLLQPMSDVPATCLWTLTFALLMSASKWPTVCAGVVAGCAGLVRPNLFVLGLAALPIAAWWRPRFQSPWTRPLLFASGLLPVVVAFVLWGRFLYGTAGRTGYGSFSTLLAVDRVWANLTRYADWLI